MSSTKHLWMAVGAMATVCVASQLIPVPALADPPPADPQSDVVPAPGDQGVLHNIIYRARVDGVSRGATITYAAEGDQTQTANPTMVPGRVFEVNTVLPESGTASMRMSIEWPYSANLTCEILVDDAIVAKAEDLIAPRVLPVKDDPDYVALTCEAPVRGIQNPIAPEGEVPPADPAVVDGAAPPSA